MGRISSIKKLPDPIRDAVDALLRDGGRSIDDIVAHLQTLGAPVSRSAVGRYKQRFEAKLSRYREAQEVAAVWVNKLGENPQGDVGRLIAEMLKTVAFQTLADMGDEDAAATPMDIMLLAKAIKDLEGAQKTNVESQLKLRAQWQAELETKAEAAKAEVAAVAQRAGLSEETTRQMRDILLGMVT